MFGLMSRTKSIVGSGLFIARNMVGEFGAEFKKRYNPIFLQREKIVNPTPPNCLGIRRNNSPPPLPKY